MHFPYSDNKIFTGNGVLHKILFLCLLVAFSLPIAAQDYIYNVPSLLIKNKSYTFSIQKENNGSLPPVLWNFGTGANPSTSNLHSVNVTYSTAGPKTVTLTVNGATTITRTVYLSDMPDNIEVVGCYIDPETTNWKPKLSGKSDHATGGDKVHILAQPFVGDVDGDRIPEVVTINRISSGGYTYSNGILIFGHDLKLKKSIQTPRMHSNSASPVVLLRLKPQDKDALIIIATDGATVGATPNAENLRNRLQAYRSNGDLVWTSDQPFFSNSPTANQAASICLVAGDINNDGIPEILAGDRIFNAETGRLVATLPAGSRGFRNLNSSNPTYMPVLADMDNDGQLEVVAGNTIYKVNITNPNGSSGNSATALATVSSVTDGFVSVADINMDGQLDVVLINGSTSSTSKPRLTVWTLKKSGTTTTAEIIAGPVSPADNGAGGSRVFIGNVDNDREPELFFSYAARLVRFDYDKSESAVANRLKQTWITTTSDNSGGTTLSMFDFDQDGKAELVYRDETHLRILDGADGSNRETFPCYSATHSEYPVVVDFNGDGHADILVSGAENEDASWDRPSGNADVRIYWFSGENNDWAPARSVWNQHGYNVVHVNEDLTIPKYQLNAGTAFAGEDKVMGTIDDVYPYNSFLQQQTSISGDGIPYFKAPKVEFPDEEVTYDYDADSDVLTVKNIKVTNTGDAVFAGPLKVTVYKDKVDNDAVILTYDRNGDIAKGETITTEFTINDFGQYLPVNDLVIRVNDAGDGKVFHRVCDDTNAESSTDAFMYIPLGELAWADNYRKCDGQGVVFQSDDKLHDENVKIDWATPGSQVFANGNTATLPSLTLNDGGRYIFHAEIKSQLNIRYTLPYLSVSPAVMYWRTDAQDGNWNNLNNWASATGGNIAAVPAPCAKVYLPGNATIYPSLSDEVTDVTIYGQPEVDEIVFRYGSELYHQYKLKYNKAYINYNWAHYNKQFAKGQPTHSIEEGASTLKRDTWHILAAPLKKMASGDFALAGQPFSWQQKFQITDGGGITLGDFSKPFPKNDIPLVDNINAIAVKMAAYKDETGYRQNYLEALNGVIEIPYFENRDVASVYPAHRYDALSKKSYFYYFDTKTLRILNSPVGAMNRARDAYRFVYETPEGEVPANEVYRITITPENQGVNGEVMVGNPFLAPIDAAAFATENSSSIVSGEGYKLLKDNGTWEQRSFTAGGIIPAWQAFVVTLQPGASTLSFPMKIIKEPVTMQSASIPESDMRTSYAAGSSEDILSVQVIKGGEPSGDAAQLQHNRHTDNPDIRKMILSDGHWTPEVFFISSDGKSSNLIQQYKPGENEISIAVKTSDVQTRLSLEFTNVAAFSASTGAGVILVDKHQNTRQDLTRNPVYSFTQQAAGLDNQHVDRSRFVLQLGGDAGPIGSDEVTEGINIVCQSGILKVTSNENIDAVSVYDLHGRLMFSNHSINLPQYTHPVSLQGKLLVVRIKTVSGKEKVQKIMSN